MHKWHKPVLLQSTTRNYIRGILLLVSPNPAVLASNLSWIAMGIFFYFPHLLSASYCTVLSVDFS